MANEANWPVVGQIYSSKQYPSLRSVVRGIDGEEVTAFFVNNDGSEDEAPLRCSLRTYRGMHVPEDLSPIPALTQAVKALLDVISVDRGWGTYPRMEGSEIYGEAAKARELGEAALALAEVSNA